MTIKADISDHLVKAEVWTEELKEPLLDTLMADKFVRWIPEFDGDQLNIPSVGEMYVSNYVEDTPIRYQDIDTGEFTFTITEYKQAGWYITDKAKQDSFKGPWLEAAVPGKMRRALDVQVETDIWDLQSSQTASGLNVIAGANHRWVGHGTGDTLNLTDFIQARYALNKANVPAGGRVAIVDPSAAVELEELAAAKAFYYNSKWEGVVEQGFTKDLKYLYDIFGFSVFESNYLADVAAETIDSNAVANAKANMFFSTQGDARPFIGSWKQAPKVESERNKDFQRDEYVLTARYGLGLYRPEALVVVLTDSTKVYT